MHRTVVIANRSIVLAVSEAAMLIFQSPTPYRCRPKLHSLAEAGHSSR